MPLTVRLWGHNSYEPTEHLIFNYRLIPIRLSCPPLTVNGALRHFPFVNKNCTIFLRFIFIKFKFCRLNGFNTYITSYLLM